MDSVSEIRATEPASARKGLRPSTVVIIALIGLCVVALVFVLATGPWGQGIRSSTGAYQTQVAIGSGTTTNRLNQVLRWEVTLQLADDRKSSLRTAWTRPERLTLLKSAVIDVIQDLDLAQPRPTPLTQFKGLVRTRVDEMMGGEGKVDRVLVTEWLVSAG